MIDERLAALLPELGVTDKAAREIIELGEPALPALDALSADPARPLHVRRAASLASHHIRARALRAPPIATPEPPLPATREFLAELARNGGTIARHDASTLVVTLPADPEMRAAVFAMYNREVDSRGEDFGGEQVVDEAGHVTDRGQVELVFWWD